MSSMWMSPLVSFPLPSSLFQCRRSHSVNSFRINLLIRFVFSVVVSRSFLRWAVSPISLNVNSLVPHSIYCAARPFSIHSDYTLWLCIKNYVQPNECDRHIKLLCDLFHFVLCNDCSFGFHSMSYLTHTAHSYTNCVHCNSVSIHSAIESVHISYRCFSVSASSTMCTRATHKFAFEWHFDLKATAAASAAV